MTNKLLISLSFLLLAINLSSSARILDELTPPIPLPSDESDPPETENPNVTPVVSPPTVLPSGQIPATVNPTEPILPPETENPNVTPAGPPPTIPPSNQIPATTNPTEPEAPIIAPVPDIPNTVSPPVSNPTTTPLTEPSELSFFMHDILGGSHPSARVVTGVVANSDANNLPFSRTNNQVFPINGGVPLNNINGVVNNNNYPFLVGLNGNNNNKNNNNNNNRAFVTPGQLPQGVNLQQLMFGSVTVVDNEITEGHELGTGVLGSVQGFYIASSSDGSSHTLVLTALLHGGEHDEVEDTISFFGVHRTATPISHLAVIGGTGKYGDAKGYATIETLPHEDQHMTDGVETITHFTVYITP